MREGIPGLDLKNFIRENILLQEEGHWQSSFLQRLDELLEQPQERPSEWVGQVMSLVGELFREKEAFSRAFFQVGLRLDDVGLGEEAIFFYRLCLAILPNPKAINNLALLYVDLGREESALEILRQGRKLFPDDSLIRENLSILEQAP